MIRGGDGSTEVEGKTDDPRGRWSLIRMTKPIVREGDGNAGGVGSNVFEGGVC